MLPLIEIDEFNASSSWEHISAAALRGQVQSLSHVDDAGMSARRLIVAPEASASGQRRQPAEGVAAVKKPASELAVVAAPRRGMPQASSIVRSRP